MVRVQWWTGLRPEEVCFLCLSMLRGIDRQMLEADFGLAHKMGYKGKTKKVTLGPMAVAAVTPFLYVASVKGVDPIFRAPRGRGKVPGRAKGAVQRHSYSQAISRVCEEHGIPHWHPNQLRHTRLTLVRAAHGLDAAQAAGGHAKADVTQVYAEVDRRAAERVARLMG
jgi:integrase